MDDFELIAKNFSSSVRIRKISMKDFRNIEESSIVFPNHEIDDVLEGKPSVLGIYGQNGSGKTSVIMALGLLQNLLLGKRITKKYESCIRCGCERATLTYEFSIIGSIENSEDVSDVGAFYSSVFKNSRYEVTYSLDITTAKRKKDQEEESYIVIENEKIAIKVSDENGYVVLPKQIYIDTSDSACSDNIRAFGSKAKFKLLAGDDRSFHMELFKAKTLSRSNSQSMIFSDDFMSSLFERYNKDVETNKSYYLQMIRLISDLDKMVELSDEELEVKTDDEAAEFAERIKRAIIDGNVRFNMGFTEKQIEESDMDAQLDMLLKIISSNAYRDEGIKGFFYSVIGQLTMFASDKLHVVDTFSMGLINVNRNLPLVLRLNKFNKYTDAYEASYKTILLNMDDTTKIHDDGYASISESISKLSDVLSTIIPELRLKLEDYGVQINEKNERMRIIDIIAERDGISIPLKYESDGIRRLVSILSRLVGVYNDPSITLAVDEIDSGIFEFLLGEVIQIMASSSKGQLIFTSHNLRPLEVLPSKYLVFTTTNAKNRYTSIAARGNSNLRDTYFRSIVLGTKSDDVYRSTDQFDIEQAFILAGE